MHIHCTRVGLLIAALAATACERADEIQPVQRNAVAEDAPSPRLPVTEPPMDRSALLLAVAKAGSATALGRDDSDEQRSLDGKRFEVRIRFGCAAGAAPSASPAASAGPFNVKFNSEDRTLRVRAAPDLTRDNPRIAAIGGESIEAVEGFWMRRPWLLNSGCPVTPQLPAAAAVRQQGEPDVSDQRVGIAQFFTATDPRTARRDGRPYEATKVLDEGAQPSRQGYDLVLAGRLKKLASGRVIVCRTSGVETPPECVVSAQFDRVRIDTPDGKTTLAEWSRP